MKFYFGMVTFFLSAITYCESIADGKNTPLSHYVFIERSGFQVLPQWENVLSHSGSDLDVMLNCSSGETVCSVGLVQGWQDIVSSLQKEQIKDSIYRVNAYVNQWTEVSDIQNWDEEDYWASPLEFLMKSGDSEDYAIFKYFTLRAIGIPEEKMKLVYMQDSVRNSFEVVLWVDGDDDSYILDMYRLYPRPLKDVMEYVPQFAFNEKARWLLRPKNNK